VVVVEELWSCVLLLEALGEFCFQGRFFCSCVCARARALVDETQEQRAEIVKVAVLFVIAVRRGGGKGGTKVNHNKGPKRKILFWVCIFSPVTILDLVACLRSELWV
jgi:hypothetical protein